MLGRAVAHPGPLSTPKFDHNHFVATSGGEHRGRVMEIYVSVREVTGSILRLVGEIFFRGSHQVSSTNGA